MSGTFNTDELVITSANVTGLLKALEGFKFPQFTTATRPSSPVVGQTIYNTDEAGLEVYDGSAWDLVKGGGAMPVYSGTGNRPAGPVVGTIGFNTATSEVEIYDGSDWVTIETAASSPITASGGNNTYESDGYKYHVFTSDGTFQVTAGNDDIEYSSSWRWRRRRW